MIIYFLLDGVGVGFLVGILAHLLIRSEWKLAKRSVLIGIISSITSLFILNMLDADPHLLIHFLLTSLILVLVKLLGKIRLKPVTP